MSGSISFDELKAYIASLDEPLRAEIAALLLGFPDSNHVGADRQFKCVLGRRIEELRSGTVKGIPAEDAFASHR